MDFNTFDKNFKEYLPKDLSKIVYKYYDTTCLSCKKYRILCDVCSEYYCKTESCDKNSAWCPISRVCHINYNCSPDSVICSHCWFHLS